MPPSTAPSEGISSLTRRFGLRVLLAYLTIYFFPFPLDGFTGAEWFEDWESGLPHRVVPWIGAHVLHLSKPITTFTNGSGDTTYNYVAVLSMAVLAVLTASVWTWLVRGRVGAQREFAFVRTYVRYALGAVMMSYGVAKMFTPGQFPFPGTGRMLQPIGQSSPMGLLWTFMGYSPTYCRFTGGAEIVGGLLLFSRRTTLAGAILVAIVMVNVVALNFCYDVPVKLFSSHLLLAALFLMAPDVPRLLRALVLHHPLERAQWEREALPKRWQEKALRVAKFAFILWLCFMHLRSGTEARPEPPAEAFAFEGFYEVETFVQDGVTVPPMVTELRRWRRVVCRIRYGGLYCGARLMDDDSKGFVVKPDVERHELLLSSSGEPDFKVRYRNDVPDHLELEGRFDGKELRVGLVRRPEPAFPLATRGFHWINEAPFNR